ncbi:MAG TPA: DUF5709 domain-containing protein [Mycobacteriales bacterium]|nr:DUF5709 domain-containing protein [Mycobacteriales bacterium]
MSSRIPEPVDPFEEEGLASPDPEDGAKRITGDVQEEIAVPGEVPTAVTDYGTTAAEASADEPLAGRLRREEPDADQPYPADPDEQVGRIVEPDEGARTDDEAAAVANDVGTDKGGFSAEERAMRAVPDSEA